MKFFANTCCIVALVASTAGAAPTAAADSNASDIETFYRAVIPAYGRDAAPGLGQILTSITKALPPPLANAVQNGIAEIFKGGDFVLNTPVDAVEGSIKAGPKAAAEGTAGNIAKTAESLPKDAGNILGVGKDLTGPKA